MAPEQVLAETAAAYAAFPSYRDAGRVETVFVRPDRPPRTVAKPFETAFVRGERFRFEFRDRIGEREWYRYLIWAHGDDTRSWWDVTPGAKTPESLAMGLAAAAGVSGGSSRTVPALLMPGHLGRSWLTGLMGLAALEDGSIDGADCHRLSGQRAATPPPDPAEDERQRERFFRLAGRQLTPPTRGPLTLWVERGSCLLRRIEESAQFDTFRTESVTDYRPEVGVPIADDELRFDPPAPQ